MLMGKFYKGEINGPGIGINSNGSSFVGEFSKGIRLKGILTSPNDFEYMGEFKNGKMHGLGVITYADGTQYVGEFKNGTIHGQGVNISADGDKYVGEFKNGTYVEK